MNASVQLSVERKAGQFDGTVTNGGGGPWSTGLAPQLGTLGSQCIVPVVVPADAEAGDASAVIAPIRVADTAKAADLVDMPVMVIISGGGTVGRTGISPSTAG
ncbi:MAG: hypothetical protein NVS3B12_30040 [Acidimicrobiales bacterium]